MNRTRGIACLLALSLPLFWLGTTPAVAEEPAEPWLTDLAFPTNMAWAPDGRLFFTEKETGDVRIVSPEGELLDRPFAHLDVQGDSERGLLGIALHPDFASEPWVYVYFTDRASQRNHLVRLMADGDTSSRLEVLIDDLPQAPGYHNGGDLLFAPDGLLYVAVGESHEPDRAQDPGDLGGKILRLEPDGSVPPDNPFHGPVFSLGHRNSFGLCASPHGVVYETENGPDVDDEINVLQPGGNYGWPDTTGNRGDDYDPYIGPILVFPQPIAITGCAVWQGDLVFGSYGESFVRRYVPGSEGAASEIMAEVPGGITDVTVGPDGLLYVATTDAIWRVGTAPTPTATRNNTSSTSPAPAPATSSPPATAGEPGGSTPVIAIAAALVLVAGLIARVWAGRKLRNED